MSHPPESGQAKPSHHNEPPQNTSPAGQQPATDVRSPGLLPADQDDPNLQIAEEVAFDLQSDGARRVGAMPADTATAKPVEALAEAMHAPAGDDIPKPD